MTRQEKILVTTLVLFFSGASTLSTLDRGLYGGSILMLALSICLIKILIDLLKYQEE